ncbi:DUF4998 domain-containing protein [Abyssalbus ytuae]|uniref:Discoidin domain-containing protein n=1 Tax=Abyssalbus ytuae TaxID=2926907 RepID=A0A9E7D0I7_9FLAO|nr:DUF4998 domain-containing protein [Abyssalbus ytuae]UOB18460.1 discoidin domain-containing protein [Abyssalbus ytuae]
MKIIFYTRSNISLLFFIAFIGIYIISCDKMEDNYQQYIEEGEILYIPKPLNLVGRTGNHRIQLEWEVTSNKKVDEWIITYDDVTVTFPNNKAEGTDKKYIIEDIAEGNYIFSVWGFNKEGNESIKEIVAMSVYGENFRETLNPRGINSFYFFDNNGRINFRGSSNLARSTEVKYYNTSGVEVTEVMNSDEFDILLPGLDLDKEIKYRTLYVPTPAVEDKEGSETILVETSIDEFPSDWKVVETEPVHSSTLERNDWVSIKESSQAYEGWNIERMWDGNIDTAWHTPWDGTAYPHSFIIDIGKKRLLYGFEIARKWDWRVPTKTSFEISLDNETWTRLGIYDNPDPDSDAPQIFTFASPVQARYFRVTFLEGTGSEAVIREFYVKGI